MTVRKTIQEHEGLYFITITCCRWLPLYERANGYDTVYKWFDYLKNKGHYIIGYVIMPNHIHCLIAFKNSDKSINSIVGNGKRFMAYDIVTKLKEKKDDEILFQLAAYVNTTDKKRGKLHEVFEPSFDCKACYSDVFIEQKLNYIHNNPCQSKWSLAEYPWGYVHSSAKFYMSGEEGVYTVTNYMRLKDVDLTQSC